MSRSPAQQTYDYVIVTTTGLLGAITSSDFIAWKESLGYRVQIVLTTDPEITTQPGVDLAERIRNFLRSVYGPWGIEYLLLVGNYATVPMRYCYPDPTNHTFNTGDIYSGEVPTDYYYADLSWPDALSWDLDGDGFLGEYGQDMPDLLTEISVGRVPTSNPAEVVYSLNKLVAFEQDTGAWKNNALHGASFAWFENENYTGRELKDLATYIALVEDDFMAGWTISHYSEQAGLVPSIYPWQPLNANVFTADWRTGQYAVINWGGHGWTNGAHGKVWSWDDGDGVPESHEMYTYQFVGSNSNFEDDYPSIVFALSCMVGFPEPNSWGNLGVDLLTDPSLGAAVGVVSGTRVVWVSQGGGELHCYEFNHYLIDGPAGPERVGDALYDSEFQVCQAQNWNHYAEYWDVFTYNLYGDPSLEREGVAAGTDAASLPEARPVLAVGNFPNPFAKTTAIRYTVPTECFVALEIYDVAGRQVATLLNAERTSGPGSVEWDASGLAGGIYFVKLRAAERIRTRKIVLLPSN
jgi:hypothetical protein